MITIQPEHRLTIMFTNDEERNDIATFIEIIKKCDIERKKAGFVKAFNATESELIEILKDNLVTEQPGNIIVQNVFSDKVKIED